MSGKDTSLAAVESSVQNVSSSYAEVLLSNAVEKGLPIETIEKIIALRTVLKAEFAKEAFDQALADFQSDCPVIDKDKHVKFNLRAGGGVDYFYAPLDSIVRQVKGILSKHGFSYSFNIEEMDNGIKATCILKHKFGHSESSSFIANMAGTSMMSDAQLASAKATFAKRNAFCNVTGIITGDDDNDALKDKVEDKVKFAATQEQRDEINELARQIGMTFADVSKRFRELYGVSISDMTAVQALGTIESMKKRLAVGAGSVADPLPEK